MKTYTPHPIDTSEIVLPKELLDLTEKIAANVHDVFVKSRLEEGWTYGEYRDDIKKTNPTLIPYEELPESEKEYDRNTALETIKLITLLGYKIEKEVQ
jgi:ryanodine receptor 2